MNTLTLTAELHDQRNTSWQSGYARQGKYDTTLHRGLIVFPDLANGVFKGKTIKNILLKFVSASAGRAGNKTLHIYTTTKNAPGGTSTAWINSANKAGILKETFYNNTKTFSDLATSNMGLFEKLKTFLENGGQSLGIFINESVTS
ncbi:MAG: hypothetical protein ACOX85_11930, partial [Candidatus Pararuminococcus gallinarum]